MNLLTYAFSIVRSRVEQFACLQASWAHKINISTYAGHLSENNYLCYSLRSDFMFFDKLIISEIE